MGSTVHQPALSEEMTFIDHPRHRTVWGTDPSALAELRTATDTDNFQGSSARQGQAFEEFARRYLSKLGYRLNGPVKVVGGACSVDESAIAPCGCRWYVEFKGSAQGSRPGMRRTDTVKKALLTGYMLHHDPTDTTPYVILTSHLPDRGAAAQMIDRALTDGVVAAVLRIGDPRVPNVLAGLCECGAAG